METPNDLFDLSLLLTAAATCKLCGRGVTSNGGGHAARCPAELFTRPGALQWVAYFEREWDQDPGQRIVWATTLTELVGEGLRGPSELEGLEVGVCFRGLAQGAGEAFERLSEKIKAGEAEAQEALDRAREEERRGLEANRCRGAWGRLQRQRADLTPEAYARKLQRFLGTYGGELNSNPRLTDIRDACGWGP